MTRRIRLRHLGLRWRFIVVFATGAAVITTVTGFLTFGLASRFLLNQRQSVATRQVYADADVARVALLRPEATGRSGLAAVEVSAGTQVLIFKDGSWYGSSIGAGAETVPASLRTQVRDGRPARQRVRSLGLLRLAVGVPLPGTGAEFYEIVPLQDLTRTLSTLRTSLLIAACIATAAAGLVGLQLSRRVLRPLKDIGNAAERIVAGDREVRLDPDDDRDLEAIAGSFNAMVDAVQRRIERDARFVTDVSHELRSPLTTLGAAVEVLTTRMDRFDPRDQQALALVADEVRRLQQAVEDLLELGRSDAGQAGVELEPVSVDTVIRQSLRRHAVEAAHVDITDDVRATPVLVDRRRFVRIVTNIVQNAEMHAGGVTTVRARRENGMLRVEIEDRGPGIPVALRENVFERFFRGPASGDRGTGGGTGLGLALVAEHVDVHGGRVRVEDTADGTGARFVVELPWRTA